MYNYNYSWGVHDYLYYRPGSVRLAQNMPSRCGVNNAPANLLGTTYE